MFDNRAIDAATKAVQPAGISPSELFTARPRTIETRNVFDRGPGEEMARVMKTNLDLAVIGKPKSGMDPKSAGIAAYNIKTHPTDVGDFGHYRGTFNNPKVVILADPDGVDDILTSRALTGTRGQYLNGLMKDMGINDQYLVIKTVPFGMDGATDQEWNTVLGQTTQYRQKIFEAILKSGAPKVIIADGKFAANEVKAIAGSIPVVVINRVGSENNSGIREAAADLGKALGAGSVSANGAMIPLPRSHMGYFARVWEGTSGTRVFDATSTTDKGTAFAIVAPQWAFSQKVTQPQEERKGVEMLKSTLSNKRLFRSDEQFIKFKPSGNDDTSLDPKHIPQLSSLIEKFAA